MGNWAQLVSSPVSESGGQSLLAEKEWGWEGRWMRGELPLSLVFQPDRWSIGPTHDTRSKTSQSAAPCNGPRRPGAEPFLTFSPRHSNQPVHQANKTTASSAMSSSCSGWAPMIKALCTLNAPWHFRYVLSPCWTWCIIAPLLLRAECWERHLITIKTLQLKTLYWFCSWIIM